MPLTTLPIPQTRFLLLILLTPLLSLLSLLLAIFVHLHSTSPTASTATIIWAATSAASGFFSLCFSFFAWRDGRGVKRHDDDEERAISLDSLPREENEVTRPLPNHPIHQPAASDPLSPPVFSPPLSPPATPALPAMPPQPPLLGRKNPPRAYLATTPARDLNEHGANARKAHPTSSHRQDLTPSDPDPEVDRDRRPEASTSPLASPPPRLSSSSSFLHPALAARTVPTIRQTNILLLRAATERRRVKRREGIVEEEKGMTTTTREGITWGEKF